MAHADGTTHLSTAHQTVVNTVLEVALPGFLRVEFGESIRPGEPIPGAHTHKIYSATILDPALSRRINSDLVAVKEFGMNSNVSEEDNDARFHAEVSLMWSLSFHPNVVGLVAYSDEPRAIVMRMMMSDLGLLLHGTEDMEPLDDGLLLHVIGGIVSGLNAIHSMHVAHRDVKPTNILLQEPSAGERFPNAVIADFSTARS